MPVRLCTDREIHDEEWNSGGVESADTRSRVIRLLRKRLVYICPSLRNVSIPRPSSWARPLRSAMVVTRSSEMI